MWKKINCFVVVLQTGTLTEDGLDLLCVVPINERRFQMAVKRVETMPYNTFVCGLVSCHSITIIDKQLMGDPLDLKVSFLFLSLSYKKIVVSHLFYYSVTYYLLRNGTNDVN